MPDAWERLSAELEAKIPRERAAIRRRDADLSRLKCVECGLTSEGSARNWRALLTVDNELATYCAACASAEFGAR